MNPMRPSENENPAGASATASGRRALIGSGLAGLAASLLASAPARAHDGSGPLSSAVISFGSWMLPLDRHPNLSPRPANHHEMCPSEVTVKAGACVSFIIAGIHQVLIYDDGTQPEDINAGILVPSTNPPFPPALIADPNRRIYRGLDPSISPQERVEAVHFDQPGTYLVICGVPNHFAQGMIGFIRVLP
jgi:plastocyanin